MTATGEETQQFLHLFGRPRVLSKAPACARLPQAEKHLMVTHPVRLGVALNHAVPNSEHAMEGAWARLICRGVQAHRDEGLSQSAWVVSAFAL